MSRIKSIAIIAAALVASVATAATSNRPLSRDAGRVKEALEKSGCDVAEVRVLKRGSRVEFSLDGDGVPDIKQSKVVAAIARKLGFDDAKYVDDKQGIITYQVGPNKIEFYSDDASEIVVLFGTSAATAERC